MSPLLRELLLLLLPAVLLLAAAASTAEACTAASHHRAAAAAARKGINLVDGRSEQLRQTLASATGGDEEDQESPPQTLFEFDTGPKAEARRDASCRSAQEDGSACSLVLLRLGALRARRLKIPLDSKDQSKFVVLEKVSEEGMAFLGDARSRATTTVTYKNGDSWDTFVSKRGRLYGSVRTDNGDRLHLLACPSTGGNSTCHLLVRSRGTVKKKTKGKLEEIRTLL